MTEDRQRKLVIRDLPKYKRAIRKVPSLTIDYWLMNHFSHAKLLAKQFGPLMNFFRRTPT